jgi:cyclic lactone autoinducer peptide
LIKKERKKMKNKKIIKKLLEEIAIKVAIADANATCPCINYQPKIPKAVKKLRKF